MTHFQSVDVVSLACVTGGQQAPQPSQPKPQPQQPKPSGGGSNDTQWISNAAKCARIGGPLLGAVCGALTPTPAY